jgi:hypothetical protein
LRTSVESETHAPEHGVNGLTQPELHVRVEGLQKGVAPAHATPHAPQFAGSTRRSTQRPPHATVPDGHSHEPLLHVRPAPHARPQAPQFAGSLSPSMQRPPQSMRPAAHTHAPAAQP